MSNPDASNPYAPPQSDMAVDSARPLPPAEPRLLSRGVGGLLFAYSFLLVCLFIVWLFVMGGILFNLLGSLVGIALGVSGLASGWRLVDGRRAGFPIWMFCIGHVLVLLAFLGVGYIEVQATR